jgi:hypothetical protein
MEAIFSKTQKCTVDELREELEKEVQKYLQNPDIGVLRW